MVMSDKPDPSAARAQAAQIAAAAMMNPNLPRIYANGFTLGISASEVGIILQINNTPIAIIDLAFPTAQSLVKNVAQLIEAYERATETRVKTPEELKGAMARITEEAKNAKLL